VVVGVSDVTVDVGLAVDLPTHHKSGETFDPVLFNATVESGSAEAQQVFDHEEQLMGPPQTKLLEGREARFPLGFAVKNPKDLVLEVSPDAGVTYKSVIRAAVHTVLRPLHTPDDMGSTTYSTSRWWSVSTADGGRLARPGLLATHRDGHWESTCGGRKGPPQNYLGHLP
jgi:hypothetical protein